MKELDAITRYYAEMVPDYESLAGYHDPEAEKIREGMKLRWQEYLRGKTVLEIACGTGYWTEVIAHVARHLTAIDINENMLSVARTRLQVYSNIAFVRTNAYTLEGVEGRFSAAFAHWWWSHIPKKKIRLFLETLHSKLENNAVVLFSDHLPDYCDVGFKISYNDDGDRIEERVMKDGTKHNVIKNFLTEGNARNYLSGIADDIDYTAYKHHWELFYRVKR